MSGGCGVDRGGGREGKNHARRVSRGLKAKVNPSHAHTQMISPRLYKEQPVVGLLSYSYAAVMMMMCS